MMKLRSLFDPATDAFQQRFRHSFLSFLIFLSLGLFLALAFNAIIASHRVYHLKIAAGLEDGESYQFAQATAAIVARYETNLRIDVIKTNGTSDNLAKLQANQVELATAQADIPAPPAAQLVSPLFPDIYQLIATEQSGVQSVADLKGKRVALPPKNGGQYQSFRFLAAHYGLNPDDPRYRSLPDDDAADRAFLNKEVDAVFHVRPPGNQAILKLIQASRGRLIAIDQAAAMKLKQPSLDATVIPKGTYQGTPPIPTADEPTVAVQRLLLAHKQVDKALIERITRLLYERRQELVTAMPIAASITPPNALVGSGLPIHPGAKAYYDREKPAFLEEHAQVFEFLLSLIVLLGSGFWQLKLKIEKKQKEKADDYIKEVIALLDANDCLQAIVALVSAIKPNDAVIQETLTAIAASVNKATVDYAHAQMASEKKKVSPRSLQSFEFMLQLLADAIAWAIKQTSHNQLASAKNLQEAFVKIAETLEAQPTTAIFLETPQTFRANSTEAIRRALEQIFKRAAEALTQERVSPESFQSFRAVWQVAMGELVNAESERSSKL